jgi:hypothetical protein
MNGLEKILAEIETAAAGAEARKRWNPSHQGEIDIRIAADGSWHHEGRPFKRTSLVKLFAGVLRREDDGYFLVTPAEKLRITVDDVPFTANLVERIDEDGRNAIVFTTNLGERIVVDREHPLRVEIDADSGEPRPYVTLRDGLEALIGRSAFYDLINLAEERERDGARYLYVTSLGHDFELGRSDDA